MSFQYDKDIPLDTVPYHISDAQPAVRQEKAEYAESSFTYGKDIPLDSME